MEKFQLVKSCYDQYGHTKMPADYVVEGVWLRRWLSEQTARLNEKPAGRGKSVKHLTTEQIARLESIGIRRGRVAATKRSEVTVPAGVGVP